jgi:predicted nucleic acid-binding protein
MKELAVIDAACLIGLERIGQLDLLPALYHPILIPPAVASEFGFSLPWLQVQPPTNRTAVNVLRTTLGSGESEAIVLAQEINALAILDDKRARRAARQLGLKVKGTVGLLVQARQTGVIPLLKPLLNALEANGFFLSDELKEEALRLVGE